MITKIEDFIAFRKRTELTQQTVASKLGIPRSTLSMYEHRKHAPVKFFILVNKKLRKEILIDRIRRLLGFNF